LAQVTVFPACSVLLTELEERLVLVPQRCRAYGALDCVILTIVDAFGPFSQLWGCFVGGFPLYSLQIPSPHAYALVSRFETGFMRYQNVHFAHCCNVSKVY
jgi:hypothetical protein